MDKFIPVTQLQAIRRMHSHEQDSFDQDYSGKGAYTFDMEFGSIEITRHLSHSFAIGYYPDNDIVILADLPIQTKGKANSYTSLAINLIKSTAREHFRKYGYSINDLHNHNDLGDYGRVDIHVNKQIPFSAFNAVMEIRKIETAFTATYYALFPNSSGRFEVGEW